MKKVVLSIMTLLVMGILTACGSVTINLNDYVTIETKGYNSLGTATYVFDEARFEEDFGDKIQIKETNEIIRVESAYGGMSPLEILCCYYIDFETGEQVNLSNGDELQFTWKCDDEVASKNFGCKLKYKDITYKVENLIEIDTFDPFEHITLSYSGVAPSVTASVEVDYTVPQMQYMSFSTLGGYLDVGDTVTVTASISGLSVEEFAQKYNVIPGVSEKTYTVEGVPYYIKDLSEISDSDMEMLKNVFIDWYKGYISENWNDPNSLTEIKYLGNYFLVPKQGSYASGNYLYLVFESHAIHPETKAEVITYLYIYYKDIKNSSEGFDYGQGTIPSTGWFSSEMVEVDGLYYVGYASVEDFYKKYIENQVGNYEFTTDIK